MYGNYSISVKRRSVSRFRHEVFKVFPMLVIIMILFEVLFSKLCGTASALIIHRKEDIVKFFRKKNGKPSSAVPPSMEKHGSGLFFYGARRGI